MRQKLFPYGIPTFVALEFAAWLIGRLFDQANLTFFCYGFIVGYIIYLLFYIRKEDKRKFSISQELQWLFLLVLPFLGGLLVLSFLWVHYSWLDFSSLLQKKENASFIAITFFFLVLLDWGVLSLIKQLVDRGKFFAYAVTCIPIKKGANTEKLTICLIRNCSHSKSAWMFPGGHVNLNKNYINERNPDLSGINQIPEEVIIRKAETEAGLKDINLLSIDSTFTDDISHLDTCRNLKTPAFTYLFNVSEHANCRKTLLHHVHFDFTYVGIYSKIEKPLYDTYEFEFCPSDLPSEKDKAISEINRLLKKGLNEKVKKELASHDLFPDSIPDMIYCGYKYYEMYKAVGRISEE